ncbi:hypothetical protein PIB30_011895 [Stylosanthes scabra]|uniref:Uncharacterized protein n=1 Tax=Stylosanthes scabra TaxID=79078 RepID=A0ABU6V494_9FABA|nr:hypothetical protein [Stylosanthes scabra]
MEGDEDNGNLDLKCLRLCNALAMFFVKRVRPFEDYTDELFRIQRCSDLGEHFSFHKNLQCSSDLQGTAGGGPARPLRRSSQAAVGGLSDRIPNSSGFEDLADKSLLFSLVLAALEESSSGFRPLRWISRAGSQPPSLSCTVLYQIVEDRIPNGHFNVSVKAEIGFSLMEEHFNFHKNLQCSSDLQGTAGVDLQGHSDAQVRLGFHLAVQFGLGGAKREQFGFWAFKMDQSSKRSVCWAFVLFDGLSIRRRENHRTAIVVRSERAREDIGEEEREKRDKLVERERTHQGAPNRRPPCHCGHVAAGGGSPKLTVGSWCARTSISALVLRSTLLRGKPPLIWSLLELLAHR